MCPFCQHSHPSDTLKRMMRDGLRGDTMLVVADLDANVGKKYRVPIDTDLNALTDWPDTWNPNTRSTGAFQPCRPSRLTLGCQIHRPCKLRLPKLG